MSFLPLVFIFYFALNDSTHNQNTACNEATAAHEALLSMYQPAFTEYLSSKDRQEAWEDSCFTQKLIIWLKKKTHNTNVSEKEILKKLQLLKVHNWMPILTLKCYIHNIIIWGSKAA